MGLCLSAEVHLAIDSNAEDSGKERTGWGREREGQKQAKWAVRERQIAGEEDDWCDEGGG
jgi:hypothetical protein